MNIITISLLLFNLFNLIIIIINKRKYNNFKKIILKAVSDIKIENKTQNINLLEKVNEIIKKRENVIDNKLKESVRILSNRIGKRQKEDKSEEQ